MIYSFVEANQKIFDILGYQKYDKNIKYVYSPYLIKLWKENNYLIKNLLTQECIMLKDLNRDEEHLVKRWFKIPEGYNPYLLFKKLQDEGNLSQKNYNNYDLLEKFDHAVIFTTLNCNANCSYCYEKKQCHNKQDMTKEVADKFLSLVYKNQPKKLRLNWFGGEPLYNVEIINYICEQLKENNIEYSSSMISNSILFSKELIEEKVIPLWKLHSIQITLDGIYETYESIKKVPKGTFNILIQNIRILLENNISVSIRLNLTENNYSELKEAIYFCYKEFSKYKNFCIYAHEIFGLPKNKHQKIFKQLRMLEAYIAYYFKTYPNLWKWVGACCMADKGDSITVLPDGRIGICEHCIDHDIVSDLDKSFYNVKPINSFSQYSDREECQLCPMRPACVFLIKCEANGGNNCSEYRKELLLYNHKIHLINEIEKEKSKRRKGLMITRNLYTNLDIYNKATALVEAFNTKDGSDLNYPVKVNFYLQKNLNAFLKAAQEIESKRMEIIQKFGKPTEEDPNNYKIDDDKIEEATKEIQDFLDLEQEIPVSMLKLDWFDNIDMTAAQVAAISFMIEEEE